jgi:hypothetical protein
MPSRIGDRLPAKIVFSLYFYVAAGFALVSAVTASLGMHGWGMPVAMAFVALSLLALPVITAQRREFVQIDDEGVAVETNKGVERVSWSEVQRVRIITTNEGPWAEDVYFLLEANGKGCVVPHGAAIRTKLLEELQTRLPGVRDDQVIEAMGCAENNSFTVWERPSAEVA